MKLPFQVYLLLVNLAAISAEKYLLHHDNCQLVAKKAKSYMNDPDTVARLVALLPEGQRAEDMLRENIRSPQVVQCLQRLTSALVDDDVDSFNSIIANFQLDPSDGADALASGNPIEAFLNCLLNYVEKKEGVEKVNEGGGERGRRGRSGDGEGEPRVKEGKIKMDES